MFENCKVYISNGKEYIKVADYLPLIKNHINVGMILPKVNPEIEDHEIYIEDDTNIYNCTEKEYLNSLFK